MKELKKLLLKAKLMTVLPEFNSEAKEMLEKVLKARFLNISSKIISSKKYIELLRKKV